MNFESGFDVKLGLKSFFADANITNVSTGLIGGFTIGLVAVPLVIRAGEAANLSSAVINSWLFSAYFFGAITGIILALGYKIPVCGAWSIPGIFAVTQVMSGFTMNEAVGAFLVSGLIILLLGLSGFMKKLVSFIPDPIMMAMVAGVLFNWALGILGAFENAPLLAIAGVIGYLVSMKVLDRIPPVLGTFVFGVIMAAALGGLNFSEVSLGVVRPVFFRPSFSVQSIISISLPLAILVIGAENMQAYGVLKAEEYQGPINAMTVISGIGGLIAPWSGGHNANIAGPMTAFCTDEIAGPKEGRYVAAVFNGIVFALFGLFAPVSISIINLLPVALIDLLVGLVLMGIITSALQKSFGEGKFIMGAFFSFVIAVSDVTLLSIGSAFWALVIGTVVSLLIEKESFDKMLGEAA
ncbi:benzoate/H(+) symporter BenE family transporter [Fuchsiella alkaliacetigena]|uniref:benzoate/H(+) symporter BenE family transporter n=1 Tax=Fuchsiella alkaliacetigena TaxID=957042 RepID=UPI00200AE7CD|nr:benzoate/H(+) symporter BenE family transporter [Fuchsiella alkaliacetigena]MCK8825378.1 benzoate/H(+) symporter BenE family transporter [Fuchsiella alkaliacetigena]